MDRKTFVPIEKHPDMLIGELPAHTADDNTANSVYSQNTEAWD